MREADPLAEGGGGAVQHADDADAGETEEKEEVCPTLTFGSVSIVTSNMAPLISREVVVCLSCLLAAHAHYCMHAWN